MESRRHRRFERPVRGPTLWVTERLATTQERSKADNMSPQTAFRPNQSYTFSEKLKHAAGSFPSSFSESNDGGRQAREGSFACVPLPTAGVQVHGSSNAERVAGQAPSWYHGLGCPGPRVTASAVCQVRCPTLAQGWAAVLQHTGQRRRATVCVQ